jgi:hypothetical protein
VIRIRKLFICNSTGKDDVTEGVSIKLLGNTDGSQSSPTFMLIHLSFASFSYNDWFVAVDY